MAEEVETINQDETFELLNQEDKPEVLEIGKTDIGEKGKEDEEKEEVKEEDKEGIDELKELEEELKEPDEEDLDELVTPVRRKEILAKYFLPYQTS